MDFYKEIQDISGIKNPYILSSNTNVYRLLIETGGGINAYYCSVPLYSNDKSLINPKWSKTAGGARFDGVNARIECSDEKIILSNSKGSVEISFSGCILLEPTYNGVLAKCDSDKTKLTIKSSKTMPIYDNGSCFALMHGDNVPFLTICCLYGCNDKEQYPIKIYSEGVTEESNIFVYNVGLEGKNGTTDMFFEINLYTPKMIFDTTVSSAEPEKNNAYGGVAFLGHTEEFGEQYLYTRFDCSQFWDLNSYEVKEANLYLPAYGGERASEAGQAVLSLNDLNFPWCSFGTTWENKVNPSTVLSEIRKQLKYEIADVTDIVKRIMARKELRDFGMVIKASRGYGCRIVSTGDNYYRPQILEIKLKQ